jgi:integrase
VWLEKEEQTLQKALRNTDDLPQNIFGRTCEHIKGVRVRYDFLFGLILNSGLRISEALSVRVRDVRVMTGSLDRCASSARATASAWCHCPRPSARYLGSG